MWSKDTHSWRLQARQVVAEFDDLVITNEVGGLCQGGLRPDARSAVDPATSLP